MAQAEEREVAKGGKTAEKYLSFSLGSEKYGMEILKVQEIIGVLHITTVPRSPDYLKGVINLRGKIIPVVDLRLKFGLPSVPYDEKTCIIVVNASVSGRGIQVGVVVDTVLEVISFAHDKIEPAPDYGSAIENSFIKGMGRAADDSVIILIEIERALGGATLEVLETTAAKE